MDRLFSKSLDSVVWQRGFSTLLASLRNPRFQPISPFPRAWLSAVNSPPTETAGGTSFSEDKRRPTAATLPYRKILSSAPGNGKTSNTAQSDPFGPAPVVPQLLINCLRNNIFFCLSREPGKTLLALSAGRAGFPGSSKTSPKAALGMLEILSRKLIDLGIDRLRLNFRGLNPARSTIIGQLRRMGLPITEVIDTTKVPHNGCRPPKRRRL
jgi:small subunit ribosomal protein S11